MIGTLLYVLEIIKYGKLYQLFYEKKVKRIWVAVLIGIVHFVLFGILFREFDSSGKCALGYACAWLACFFMMQENWKKRGTVFLVLFLTLIGLEQVICIPIRIVNLFVDVKNYLGAFDSVLLSFLVMITVLIACIWKKKRRKVKRWNLNNRTLYFLIVFMVIGMLVTVSCVDYAEEYVSNLRFSILTIILCAVSYVSIGMLGIFVIHIRNVNGKMEEMLQSEIILKDMQKSYYEALLKKEEETRNYRHDMAGHLLCLENFAKEHKNEELTDYLGKMRQQMSQIQGKCYMTGNQVIDVITNHYLSGLDTKTEVRVSGLVDEKLEIDNVSLCTIYMNLLKNAIEEIDRTDDGRKILKIDFLQGKQYFGVKIQNSLSKKSLEKPNVLDSEKEDKRNHGIGLKNVEKVVKEYGGEFDVQCDKDLFVARVVLKHKSDRLTS